MIPMTAVIQSIDSEEDRSFVEQLYLKYKDAMFQKALSILNNRDDAEDAVSKTVENIIKSLDVFDREPETAEKLVYIYLRNTAFNIYRKNQRKAKHEVPEHYKDIIEEDGTEVSDFSVDDIVISRITAEKALEAAKKLPEALKDVLFLYYFAGYSYSQIAALLGISVNSVGIRLHRAKAAIKEAIDGEK